MSMFSDARRWFVWPRSSDARGQQYKWVIEPVREGFFARAQEVWRYRRILWFMSAQMVKRRYQGMMLGPLWLFVRPLGPIIVSTFIFGRLLGVGSDGVPYFLFFLTGQASWYVFERSLMMTTRSLDMNRSMLKKVYFPRVIAPISAVGVSVAYFVGFFGLLLMSAIFYLLKDHVWYLRFGPALLLAPLCTILSLVLAIAVGLWTSIWQLRVKEMRYTIRYFTHFWSYLTPVIYPMSQVPEQHRWIIYANPMAPLVETFKWSVLGIGTFPAIPLICAVGVIFVVLLLGLWYFSWCEGSAIDRM